jgi:hypothetical protein
MENIVPIILTGLIILSLMRCKSVINYWQNDPKEILRSVACFATDSCCNK